MRPQDQGSKYGDLKRGREAAGTVMDFYAEYKQKLRTPEEAVRTMARIAERAESDIHYRQRMKQLDDDMTDITTAISHATCTVASDIQAKAIITVTISGFTAKEAIVSTMGVLANAASEEDTEIVGAAHGM